MLLILKTPEHFNRGLLVHRCWFSDEQDFSVSSVFTWYFMPTAFESHHRLLLPRCDHRTYGAYVIFPLTYVQYAYVILPYVDLI